jgi:hypothetical protein
VVRASLVPFDLHWEREKRSECVVLSRPAFTGAWVGMNCCPICTRGTDVAWHSLYESFAAEAARPSQIGFVVVGN